MRQFIGILILAGLASAIFWAMAKAIGLWPAIIIWGVALAGTALVALATWLIFGA